jgi:ankyrin repeat protein
MAVFIAIKQNKLESVIKLLVREDINCQNGRDYTPLNWSLFWKRTEIISYLLDHNADPNLPNHQGWVPLHYAIHHRLTEFIYRLLQVGADVNLCDKEGYSLLYYAMVTNQYDIMKSLLDRSLFEQEQIPTLYEAVKINDTTAINLLLQYNINVNAVHPVTKQTALHLAVKYSDLVAVLLARGADLNIQDKDGNTPLHLGVGCEAVMDKLLAGYADPYLANNAGNTILHLAVSTGNISVVKKLLALNINIHHPNNKGETCVCNSTNPDIVELLCHHGADLNVNKGSTPLFHELYRDTRLVEIYLKYRGNFDLQDRSGKTVLHHLAYNGSLNLAQKLLEAGADPEIRDLKGKTAKDIALERRKQSIVELLEKYEFVPDIKEPIDY